MTSESITNRSDNNAVMLEQLAPIAAHALDTHLDQKDKREWLPANIVPFARAEEKPQLDDATLSALYINGLTEDNLPHYTATIKRLSGRLEPWSVWNNRWTWEESLHTRGIERYVEHIGVFDNDWLEGARKQQITGGAVPEQDSIAELAIYATIQEELTRIAHSRLGRALEGIGKNLFGNIAGDEARHHRFYATISAAIREQFPDEFALAALPIIRNFEMPGTGIPGFNDHSDLINEAGLFTSGDVVGTIGKLAFGLWSIDSLGDEVFSDEAKRAHDSTIRRLISHKRALKIPKIRSVVNKQQGVLTWVNGLPVMASSS